MKYLPFAFVIFLFACDKYVPVDQQEVFVEIKNDLKSPVKLQSEKGMFSGTIPPGGGIRGNTFNWFSDTISHSSPGNYFKIKFENGKTKTDWRCSFFESEPSYFSLCNDDSLSLFSKQCYTMFLSENDTVYHYSITEHDSLEAN